MPIDRRTLIGGAVGLSFASAARGQDTPYAPGPGVAQYPPAEHFKLWPGRPPGAPATLPRNEFSIRGSFRELGLRGISEPLVGVFRPARPDGRAVLAIPGGGYSFVSYENEGIKLAQALTPHGITVFALAYRLPAEGWANRSDVPLQDAQRAMRLIRARAASWGIDPARLGVCGFSAGGHLAASLTVGHADRVYAPVDAADRQSARPDFSGLIYPVINFDGPGMHVGSRDKLLGDAASAALKARYNTDKRIAADTPPLFLAHSFDDTTVGIDQSLAVIAAARAANVPIEAHLFQSGGHGYGARHAPEGTSRRAWPDLFAHWIANR